MTHLCIICGLEFIISTLISPPVVRGTLDGNYAYTSGVNGRSTGVYGVSGGGALSTLRQDILGDKKLTVLHHSNAIGGGSTALLRWQLIERRFNYVLYRGGDITHSAELGAFPLPLLEAAYADGLNASDRQRRYQDYVSSGKDGWGSLGSLIWANHGEPDAVKKRIFFDIWARGSKLGEVSLTEPHLGNRLTREDFHPERKIRSPARNVVSSESNELLWERVGEWSFDWTGPFYVAVSEDDRFFVTDTGRVFFAPPSAKPWTPLFEPWKGNRAFDPAKRVYPHLKPKTPLKEIWKGPPVDALIHDSVDGTWYAFTKDQFFDIAETIEPRPHNIVIRRAWTANEALEIAVKCGRVIRSLPAVVNDRTWDELASMKSQAIHSAFRSMFNQPARAVALLKERLKPVAAPPAKDVAALIDDLGAESVTKREAAQKRLREFGQTIEPVLREATHTPAPPERNRRLNQLLTECERVESRTPDEVRAVRAVQVLKRIHTLEAIRLLEKWAKGADTAVLTREARKALQP